jgi:DNA-binding PadR family transcriptional regulator
MALAYAILVALETQGCSGYDLAKQFDRSVGFFWKATFQQIYRELTKLETQGWIQAEVITQSQRPDKKLYGITELGRSQLTEWLAQPCDPPVVREELLVKLFAGHLGASPILVAELQRHYQLHRATLETYRAIEQQFFGNPRALCRRAQFQYLTLRKGIRYETDYLAWCEEAIAWIETMPPDEVPVA